MALSAFDDKTKRPLENDLAAVLGKVLVRWNELKRLIASRFDPCSEEWGFTSKNTGWGLRLKHGKRIILYMTPCRALPGLIGTGREGRQGRTREQSAEVDHGDHRKR
jgi:hypothetical protein